MKSSISAWFLALFVSSGSLAKTGPLMFSVIEDDMASQVGTQILTEAYSRLNIELDFSVLPAGRVLRLASQGELDGEVARTIIIEKTNNTLIRINVPIHTIVASLYAMRNVSIDSPNRLRDLDVICVRGLRKLELLAEKIGFTCIFSRNHAQGLEMLKKGRADILVGLEDFMEHLTLDDTEGAVKRVYENFDSATLYHYLHQRHADLVEPITQVMAEMQRSGRISDIHKGAINSTKSAR